jgi:hypothetical protein
VHKVLNFRSWVPTHIGYRNTRVLLENALLNVLEAWGDDILGA